jgi:hypothetical protein
MENKIIFMIVAILLIFVMFSKTGTNFIKRVLGIVKESEIDTATQDGTNKDDGKLETTDGRKVDPKDIAVISSGMLNG